LDKSNKLDQKVDLQAVEISSDMEKFKTDVANAITEKLNIFKKTQESAAKAASSGLSQLEKDTLIAQVVQTCEETLTGRIVDVDTKIRNEYDTKMQNLTKLLEEKCTILENNQAAQIESLRDSFEKKFDKMRTTTAYPGSYTNRLQGAKHGARPGASAMSASSNGTADPSVSHFVSQRQQGYMGTPDTSNSNWNEKGRAGVFTPTRLGNQSQLGTPSVYNGTPKSSMGASKNGLRR
jgi:hypothetical protein